MGCPNGMVFGTGCILNTLLFIREVTDYLNISTGVISDYVVGKHGVRYVMLSALSVIGSVRVH